MPLAISIGMSFVRRGKSVVWVETGCDDLTLLLLRPLLVKESPFMLEDDVHVRYFSLRYPSDYWGTAASAQPHRGVCAERHPDRLAAGLGRLLEQCQAAYDVVIVSASSLGSGLMPLVVTPYCRSSLLVADLRQSRRDEIVRVASMLRGADSGVRGHGCHSQSPAVGQEAPESDCVFTLPNEDRFPVG